MSATAAPSYKKARSEMNIHTPSPVKYRKVTRDRFPHRDFQKDWRRIQLTRKMLSQVRSCVRGTFPTHKDSADPGVFNLSQLQSAAS